MKHIIFIGDGMADYPLKELDGKTPLQVAKTPNIDALASKARCGLFRTIPEDFNTGSAVANLSVLGYDPKVHFHGRGVLEAAAMGIKIGPNDVALRVNTLCIAGNKIKNHSGGHISNKEGAELIKEISKRLGTDKVKFYPGVSYRHLLVLKDEFSEDVECEPPHDHPGEEFKKLLPKPMSEKGKKTAELLNKLISDSKEILGSHPVNIKRKEQGKDVANMLWPWSPGKKPSMKTFQELYKIKGAVISAVDLVKGLGIYAGFDAIKVEGATGLFDTNFEDKADAAVKALEKYDFVYVHLEAPDEASHEGNLKLKIKTIEDFDKRLVGRVVSKIDMGETVIAVLPDHPTPIESRIHVRDPVPFLVYNPNVEGDSVKEFDEKSVKNGSLGLVRFDGFIQLVIEE
jgi:2,3-bisphosphoglycerate-independent phosphoglycerate mutase